MSEFFDLEAAIASWRHSLRVRRTFLDDDLDELEDHLRHEIEIRVAEGASARTAFLSASGLLGSQVELDRDYKRVRFGRTKRRRNLARALAGSFDMSAHYLRTAVRTLTKSPGHTALNVAGLAVALVVCLVIGLMVNEELSYDRFHDGADRIYRVRVGSVADAAANGDNLRPMLRAGLAGELRDGYTDVEEVVRIFKHWEVPMILRPRDAAVSNSPAIVSGSLEPQFYFADPSFLDIFSFELLSGNAATALNQPNSVLITESAAERYFGPDEDPLGQTLLYKTRFPFTVTGVLADIPGNSHLQPEFVASMVTLPSVSYDRIMEQWSVFYTYTRLRAGADPDMVAARAQSLVRPDVVGTSIDPGDHAVLELQPITDIHLRSHTAWEIETNGDIQNVRLMVAIALLILVIASINHVNLATARAGRRAREVAVRKFVGARRRELIWQFYLEAFLLVVLSLVAAALILVLITPIIANTIGESFSPEKEWALLATGGFLLLGGMTLLSGGYPALVLSRFSPGRALQAGRSPSSQGGRILRNILVLVQFSASAVLIVLALVVRKQMDHLQDVDIGFEPAGVVVATIGGQDAREQLGAVKEAFRSIPGVEAFATSGSTVPGQTHSGSHRLAHTSAISVSGSARVGSIDNPAVVQRNWVDPDYFDALSISFETGRGFRTDATWESDEMVLNESAAQLIGFADPEDAIGTRVLLNPGESVADNPTYEIVGVVNDFNFEALYGGIGPLVFTMSPVPTQLLVRIGPRANTNQTVAALTQAWVNLTAQPFTYRFLEDDLKQLYARDLQWGRLLRLGSLVALFIAALGLFGLASFAAESRTREIGIRKAMGATAAGIVILVSKDFVRLILAALIIGVPMAWLVADRWLAAFAYRTSPGVGIFVVAAVLLITAGLAAVSFHAGSAAAAKPVDSLRGE